MKYKVGDKVRIKSLGWYHTNKDNQGKISIPFVPSLGHRIQNQKIIFSEAMAIECGTVMTIEHIIDGFYIMKENKHGWTDEMIEGLVEEEIDLIPKFGEYSDNEPLDIPTITTDFVKEHGFPCPDGYIFKDENGNVINASKIVLEKKKPKYPNNFYHSVRTLGLHAHPANESKYKEELIHKFHKLLICRDAYWKRAGEEMGLGKPWEPDWTNEEWPDMAYISYDGKSVDKENGFPCCNMILIFPTEEMRDAFYENFKELIEECKELL